MRFLCRPMDFHGPANEENEFQENENSERFMRCSGKSWILPSSTNPHYCEIICFFSHFSLISMLYFEKFYQEREEDDKIFIFPIWNNTSARKTILKTFPIFNLSSCVTKHNWTLLLRIVISPVGDHECSGRHWYIVNRMTQAYSEPSRISKMKFFPKIVNGL